MVHNAIPKTLGPKTALLFTHLYEQGKTTFALADVEAITGIRGTSARTLVHKAAKRGLLTRLQPGLYTLVPFELGNTREYVGDPYLIASCTATTTFFRTGPPWNSTAWLRSRS
jgi:predicted transcriptional regulator of viral defense system